MGAFENVPFLDAGQSSTVTARSIVRLDGVFRQRLQRSAWPPLRVFLGRLTRQAPSCGGSTVVRTWPAFTSSGTKRAIAWNAAIWFE